jgi:hypothetical protein
MIYLLQKQFGVTQGSPIVIDQLTLMVVAIDL